MSGLVVDLGDVSVDCPADDLVAGFSTLLREMREVVGFLRPDERDALRWIMSRESGTLTVGEMFPGFTRGSEGHKTLRRLRAAQFVRPAEHGCWSADVLIEVKGFARLLWNQLGEAAIFGDAPAEQPGPTEAPEDDAVVLLPDGPAEPSEPSPTGEDPDDAAAALHAGDDTPAEGSSPGEDSDAIAAALLAEGDEVVDLALEQ